MAKAKNEKGFFDEVLPRLDVDELERGVLKFWEKDKTFEKSLSQRKGEKLFTFYDGPPYATGKPHYGHVLQSAIKDTVLRYKTMRGYYVPRRVGWDTHGLPVEVLVEKELGLKNKRDIEAYGIEEFNQKCRETVFRYVDIFRTTLQRLGRWADYENDYATLNRPYMESEWWVFKQLWDKGLVYKDFRSTPYCIRCGTPLSNFEAGDGYKDKTDLTVYAKLKVTQGSPTSPKASRGKALDTRLTSSSESSDSVPLYLLVWTTTPWTLPANVAVAVNKDLQYVSVEHEDEEFVLAKERVEAVFGTGAPPSREASASQGKIVKEWKLEELLELKYEPLFSLPEGTEGDFAKLYSVVTADHVTADEGTGLVHMAPAFGAEDQQVGKKNGLPMLRTIDGSGVFKPEVPKWAGLHIWKANPLIAEDLKKRGLLFKEEQYTHSYPHCWRCDQPLIYYALDTWFVKVTDLKERMLAANEKVHWIPKHIKHGRFGKGIQSAPDWAVSRNRFWSTPLPLWECDSCGDRVCVGSVEELQTFSQASEEHVQDLHRPYVDRIEWKHEGCEGMFKRVPEVLDVWFDAGSMPYAQWHYPFENKEFLEKGFPADFIAESIEMTRAWFYVLHVLAVALKNEPAYKNVIGSGIIFGDDGNKLSKKLKNYPEIDPTIKKYGADTVRMFFMSSTFGEPYVFSEKELGQLFRNFTMTLWNVYSFFVRYADAAGWKPREASLPAVAKAVADRPAGRRSSNTLLDEWILARLHQLEYEVMAAGEEYRFDAAARAFLPFIDDLSKWYVRRSRSRFQVAGRAEQEIVETAAFEVLYGVLVKLTKLLAPFTPFLAEALYANLVKAGSVHLQDLSRVKAIAPEEEALLSEMKQAREIVSAGLALRAKAGIKVRQPLAQMIVQGKAFRDEISQIVTEEVNVKEIQFSDSLSEESSEYAMTDKASGERQVALHIQITEALQLEGMARDIIRHGQVLRRKAEYNLNDKIQLILVTESELLGSTLKQHQDMIAHALQAEEILRTTGAGEDAGEEMKIEGEALHLGVKRQDS